MPAPTRGASESRAARVLARADVLAGFSEEQGRLTRLYGTRSLVEASEQVAGWMEAAGMTVRRDAVANVIGRLEAKVSGGTFVLGSHLDTVRDAGRYDGPLGVLVAIEAVDEIRREIPGLPFSIEVVSFADEEGARFDTAYLGSRAYAGLLEERDLDRGDDDGIRLVEAIKQMGGDPAGVGSGGSAPSDLLGYVEVHIEQGTILQEQGVPLGIVTEIAGQSRGAVVFEGTAGHAGTTAMALRRDALAGAAAFVLEVERLARERPGLVATVGDISNDPNVGNVIPGRTIVSYDVRHRDDAELGRALEAIHDAAASICRERGLELEWRPMQDDRAVPMSGRLVHVLARAFEEAGLVPCELGSGAGHDAVSLASLTEVAMLFVRCKDGISHNPGESVRKHDVAAALDVLGRFLRLLVHQ